MKYFFISLFTLSRLIAQTSTANETKLSLQVVELEMQLIATQYENSKLTMKLLEENFKQSQNKLINLQNTACISLGGKTKEDCNFTPNAVALKTSTPKPKEDKQEVKK